tara:strand:- start:32885 stop:33253 length:369 start_codon:yes stop_codon:yes gene_type:complete
VRKRLCVLFVALSLLWPVGHVFAVRSKAGPCGSKLPSWGVQNIGKNRYRVSYKSMPSLLKFYRKVYGYRNNKVTYRITKLFALRHVTAYHIRSLRKSTSWQGLNLVKYKRKGQMQVYVICRK